MASENGSVGFKTQRQKVIAMYEKAGMPFLARTKPYKCTRPFTASVVDTFAGATGTPMAHAKFAAGQVQEFYAYGVGDAIDDGRGLGTTLRATEADTNLATGHVTNGAEDMVIEAMSSSGRSIRVRQPAPGGVVDPTVLAMYDGLVALVDPAALAAPPQCGSAFLLLEALFEAIAPHIAVEFEWDRKRVEKIGTLDEIPEGGAKALQRAHGFPWNGNRYKIPEGYLWRREGQPDSKFLVRCTLANAVVVPISLVALLGAKLVLADGEDPSNVSVPSLLIVDIVMRLHGLACDLPSNN